MKKTSHWIMAMLLIAILVAGCSDGTGVQQGASAGIPSWLADKTWVGEMTMRTSNPEESPYTLPFVVKTSENDIFISSPSGTASGSDAEISIDMGDGFLHILDEYGIPYTEKGTDTDYTLSAPDFVIEEYFSDEMVSADVRISADMELHVDRLSDIQIILTISMRDMQENISMTENGQEHSVNMAYGNGVMSGILIRA